MAVADAEMPRDIVGRGTPSITLLSLLGVLTVFVTLSIAGAHSGPVELVAGTIGAIAVAAFVLVWPRAALQVAFFLILVATTKFRERDAMALLSGDFDSQVIFELLCYAGAILAILVNLVPALRRGRTVPLTRTDLLLGGYVLLALGSVVWSVHAPVTIGRAFQLATLYLLCAVSVRRLGPGRTLATLAAAVVIYVLVATSLATFFPWAQHQHPGDQFAWFAVHPIDTATFAGSAALIVLAGAMYAPDVWRPALRRLALWTALAICVAVLLAAHARAPLFAFAAATCVLWVRKYLPPRTAVLALGVLVLLAGAGLTTIASSYSDTAATPDLANPVVIYVLRGQSGDEFLGLSGRVELWDHVTSLVRDQPFIGHGYVASRSILLERFPWAGTSHGALPEVLLNLGLAGAILLGMVLLRGLAPAFARMGARGPDTWGEAMVLGSLVFLAVLATANDSFAGAPGYEVLAFMAVTMAQPHLRTAREDPAAA